MAPSCGRFLYFYFFFCLKRRKNKIAHLRQILIVRERSSSFPSGIFTIKKKKCADKSDNRLRFLRKNYSIPEIENLRRLKRQQKKKKINTKISQVRGSLNFEFFFMPPLQYHGKAWFFFSFNFSPDNIALFMCFFVKKKKKWPEKPEATGFWSWQKHKIGKFINEIERSLIRFSIFKNKTIFFF